MKEFPVGKSSKVIVSKIHHFHGISYNWSFHCCLNPINFGATNFDTSTVQVGYSQWQCLSCWSCSVPQRKGVMLRALTCDGTWYVQLKLASPQLSLQFSRKNPAGRFWRRNGIMKNGPFGYLEKNWAIRAWGGCQDCLHWQPGNL